MEKKLKSVIHENNKNIKCIIEEKRKIMKVKYSFEKRKFIRYMTRI